MRKKLVSIVLLTVLIVGCSKTQQVIFEAQSISYRNKDSWAVSEIQKECSAISEELSSLMSKGWKVVASSPKEKLVYHNSGTCVGTEYILEK